MDFSKLKARVQSDNIQQYVKIFHLGLKSERSRILKPRSIRKKQLVFYKNLKWLSIRSSTENKVISSHILTIQPYPTSTFSIVYLAIIFMKENITDALEIFFLPLSGPPLELTSVLILRFIIPVHVFSTLATRGFIHQQ